MGEQITLEEYKAATSLDPQASYASIIRCATSTDQRADNMRYALSLPGLARLHEVPEPQTEPVAVVGLGPSLHDTWEKIRDFRYILSMSGSHRFLIDRAIVPTWHLDIDPRFYKYRLIGQPHLKRFEISLSGDVLAEARQDDICQRSLSLLRLGTQSACQFSDFFWSASPLQQLPRPLR